MSAINHFIKKGVRQAEIDEYLGRELSRAGYGGVDVAKTPLGERVTVHAARPGIVIGRRGKNIRMITDELITKFGFENPQIEVKEVANPETNAKVMAYSLVSAIERGVHRRRAAYSVLRRVVNSGAKGCEIIISGKLTSKRSRHEAYRMGLVAKSGEIGNEYVQRANATAIMKLGTIGVTVNIMRGDIQLPDEISIKNIRLEDDEIIEEIVEVDETKEAPKKPAAKKEIPKEEKEAKKPKEEPKKEKPVSKKKTDLDKEVEELSDLIEKTPGEKPKKTPTKKPTTKKPAAKKPEEKEPKKDQEKPKAKPKTTKKEEEKPKTKTTKAKKPAEKADLKTKKETPKAKSSTKTPTTKKTDSKVKSTAKKSDSKAKSITTKKTETKTTKSSSKKGEKSSKTKKESKK